MKNKTKFGFMVSFCEKEMKRKMYKYEKKALKNAMKVLEK